MANALSQRDGQQVLRAVYDADENSINTLNLSGLVPESYDKIELTYVTSGNGTGEIETVTYTKDASTVATLTLAYDGSDRLASVTRS